MSRITRTVALLALLTCLSLVPARTASAEPASAEAEFVQRTNALRADKGLAPLTVDAELTAVARAWSKRMADEGQLSHNPELSQQVGDWQMLGENVGYGGSVEAIHQAFVNSPHHYDNLVEARFTHVGMGVVERDGTIWVTEAFKQPRQAPKPAPAATPAPRPAAAPRPAPVAAAAPARAPRPAAPVATTVPAPVVTTAPPAPATTTSSIAAPDVAGRHYERPRLPDPIRRDIPTLLVVSALLLGAAVPLARAVRAG